MTVTTAKEWRARNSVELLLPYSQNTVQLRPLDASFFFRAGKVPDYLAATVQKLIKGEFVQQVELPDEEFQKSKDWVIFLDELVKYAFVSPKVVDSPREGENEIGPDEIEYNDKLFIYRFFGQPAEAMRRFRLIQIKSLASLDVTKNNGTSPQQALEHSALGESNAGHEG